MHFGRDSEGANELEMPAIVKINQLLNQISTNLANTLYDTSQTKDKGTFSKYGISKSARVKFYLVLLSNTFNFVSLF